MLGHAAVVPRHLVVVHPRDGAQATPWLKQRLIDHHRATYWVPAYVDAREWAVSRNRYWEVIGSVEELQRRAVNLDGALLDDIHRENIDGLRIKSRKKGRRVDKVFDSFWRTS